MSTLDALRRTLSIVPGARALWQNQKPARRRVFISIIAALIVFALLTGGHHYHKTSALTSPVVQKPLHLSPEPPGAKHGPYVKYWQRRHWQGWSNVEHMFIFGDSWSITGFDANGQQPNISYPVGEPEGYNETSTNGPCWVNYLTTVHNESLVLTANLAAGGATVDMDLIAPGVPKATLRSLKTQMTEQFPALYGERGRHEKEFPWQVDSTIFLIWIGLNDIHNADDDSKHMFGDVFDQFRWCVDILYYWGARNIMFINQPPIERAPLAEIINTYDEWHEWVAQWNANVTSLVHNFTSTHDDVTTFIFDAFKLYGDVMSDPCIMPESCHFVVTTQFCPWYAFGTWELDFLDERCPYSVDKYFWMNDLHPTTHAHNMTARAIAMALMTNGIK